MVMTASVGLILKRVRVNNFNPVLNVSMHKQRNKAVICHKKNW